MDPIGLLIDSVWFWVFIVPFLAGLLTKFAWGLPERYPNHGKIVLVALDLAAVYISVSYAEGWGIELLTAIFLALVAFLAGLFVEKVLEVMASILGGLLSMLGAGFQAGKLIFGILLLGLLASFILLGRYPYVNVVQDATMNAIGFALVGFIFLVWFVSMWPKKKEEKKDDGKKKKGGGGGHH